MLSVDLRSYSFPSVLTELRKATKISVYRASFHKPAWSLDTEYAIGYSLEDAGGLASTAVVKDDTVRSSARYPDHPEHASHNAYFETGAGESLFDGVFGTTVDIRASDRHDNSRTTIGLERSNFYGQMAKELGPMASTETAGSLGLVSGFTAGMGGTARIVKAVVDDPLGFVNALGQLARMMDQLGLLPKLLAAMPGQMVEEIKDKQDRNNPYDPATEADHYGTFEAGYYLGYGGYYLASIIVGERVKTVAKNAKRFQRMVDRLDSNGRVTQANRYLDAAKGRTSDPVKKTGYKLGARAAEGSWQLSKRSARRIIGGAKTAGGQVRLYRHMRQIDGHKIDDLSSSQENRLRTLIARTGDDGVETINRLDKDTVDDLLGMRRVCSRTGPGTFAVTGSNCLDEETIQSAVQSVAKATDDPDISNREVTDAVQRIDAMDEPERTKAVRVLADADADGVRFISSLDDRSARKVFDSYLSPDTIATSARKYGELDAEYQRKFDNVLSETDAGESWIGTISTSRISKSDIRTALDRIDKIDENGHETKKFMTASDANDRHIRRGNSPPHEEGSVVIEFETKSDDTFWRVYQESRGPDGGWLVRKDTIEGFDSKKEVIDELGLLPEKWNTEYNHLGKLELGDDRRVTLRMGTAGEMKSDVTGEYSSGGATQYELVDTVDEDDPAWGILGPLDEYVD